MRKLFTLLLYSINIIGSATDYYISSSGNDAANGLSSSAPWKSITKVNTEFNTLKPGDRILFNRGDTFTGTLNITNSGSNGNPITIGAYGSGAEPIINGFTTITDWTNYGGGIYSKVVSCASSPLMVTFDGVNTGMGRYPDATWLSIDSDTQYSLTDSYLDSGVTNWTGAEVTVKCNYFCMNHVSITSHTGNTLNYTSGTIYRPSSYECNGYFIQNDLRTLTSLGEWYYNKSNSTFYMYFGGENPNNHTVKVASINNAFVISNRSYITIDGISVQGFNNHAFYLNVAPYIIISNCHIAFIGINVVDGRQSYSNVGASTGFIFTNNTISDIGNNGMHLYGGFTNAKITGNIFNNIGMIEGGGYGRENYGYHGIYIGEYATGNTNTIIEYNTFTNIGYIPINFYGTNYTVRNNYINGFCLLLDDGGGIYTFDGTAGRSCTVSYNIILNGTGNGGGRKFPTYFCPQGIYTDGSSNGITVTNNTVAYVKQAGYFSNSNNNGTVTDNTFYGNGYGTYINGGMANMSFQRNTLFSRTASDLGAFYNLSVPSSAILDYNCYTRPISETSTIRYPSGFYTLAQWIVATGKDAHSYTSSTTVTNTDKIRFEYNATKSNKVIVLDGNYVDVEGNKYSESLTLAPFTSSVLMIDPNPSKSPAIPVYSGSTIGNSTPSILEMTYNLTLANIVPAISAFSVSVNSSPRPINSVTISGTKVLLTLSSPVAYNDKVTVAYTKPSTNPLQTFNGGQAETITAKTVTNLVAVPDVPVYINSSIENTSPSKLEITFSLTLATIVPAISAFTVKVNSTTRTVNSIVVSGLKVQLTLANPVAYDDVVTFAYAKPTANPLQAISGGQVVTISAQTVTNRVTAPEIPVYVSSAIENAAPSRLEITYNMTLANIIPPASAFTVMVNSNARSISSVNISSTKVLLTLANPVTFSDAITISYTKPSANSLQASTGGQAASLTTKTVKNNVQLNNTAPVVIVNYQPKAYSGFVNELNASGSYDANSDKLTFSWAIPGNISASSTSGSRIQYLSPVVDGTYKVHFILNVSDGKTIQSKIIPVEIVPYEPGLDVAEVVKVEASDFAAPNYPSNIIDGNIGTMWAVNGDNQWLLIELKEPFSVQHVKLAFPAGQKNEFSFDILGSEDMVTWESILIKSISCAFSGDLQVFDFPPSKADKEFKYIKLIGHCNSTNTWNYISEFRIFGYRHKNPLSYEQQLVKIFPNPAHEFVNIQIDDNTMKPDFIRIINLAGNIVFQDKIDPDINNLQIPIDLNQGLYIIEMGSDGNILFAQKLVVHRK